MLKLKSNNVSRISSVLFDVKTLSKIGDTLLRCELPGDKGDPVIFNWALVIDVRGALFNNNYKPLYRTPETEQLRDYIDEVYTRSYLR